MMKQQQIPLQIGGTKCKYFCDKCQKEITHDEAFHNSIARRRKLMDDDPQIFDVWFEDWCNECVKEWDPYS